MVDIENSRIYEVLNPRDPPSWTASNGSKAIQRSKTVGVVSSGHRVQNGFANYAVPRSVNTTPPLHRPNPPALPPRNRHCSEGEKEIPLSASLGSSPCDRGFVMNGRVRTPSAMTKSPSILSVGSTQSIAEELSLFDFMSRYSKSLPHRVKVCKGFYGVSERTAVTTGDLLNLHFLKSTKVVIVETIDKDESTKYSIPISTSIRFCPLYDPNDNQDEARRGFMFETVGDMMSKKKLPKLMKATKSFQGSNTESSVTENELLVVKNARSKITGKQLKVYSLTSQKRKTLNENCAGHFTTSPSQLKLHLYEIYTHLSDFFPYKAVLSFHETLDSVLNDLRGMTVIMKRAVTEVSVIATSALDEPEDGELPDIAEMPIDLDIEVESVGLDENEIEHLRQDTSEMYDTFDPFSVCLYMKKPTSRQYDIQCELYKTLITGDHKGLDVVRPATIAQSNKRSNGNSSEVYQPLAPQLDTQTCTDYYVLMNPRDRAKSQESGDTSDQSGESNISEREHLSLLQSHLKHIEKKLIEDISRLISRMDHLERRYDSMQTQIRMLHSDRPVLNRSTSLSSSPPLSVDDRPPAPLPLEPQLELPDRTYHVVQDCRTIEYSSACGQPNYDSSRSCESSGSGSVQGQTSLPDMQESNRNYLASLNHQQVLDLLDLMSLKLYQDNFKREQVNGEILSECDDEVLTNDLGVSSKLHRIKLMKIISGRYSARSILDGEDPYARKKRVPEKIEY